MLMPDVNVLKYAFDSSDQDHATALAFIESARGEGAGLALSPVVMSALVRLSINPKASRRPPRSTGPALRFCRALIDSPGAVIVTPGIGHWTRFEQLCERTSLTYQLVPDAYLASLALDADCEWVTFDSDFRRFPGLRWRHLPSGQLFTNPT